MKRKTNSPSFRSQRQSSIEKLENREVFSFSIWPGPIFQNRTADQWAEAIIASAESKSTDRFWSSDRAGELGTVDHFKSRQSAVDALIHQADSQWGGLFGKTVDIELLKDFPVVDYWQIDHPALYQASNQTGQVTQLLSLDSGAGHFSNRNNQIVSVEEADHFEITRDGYVFSANQGTLRIIDARDPKDLRKVSSISIDGYQPQFHLLNHRLVVVSQKNLERPWDYRDRRASWQPKAEIQVYDIQDLASPRLLSSATFEGTIHTSRLVGDRLVLIASTPSELPKPRFTPTVNDDFRSSELTSHSIGRFETREEYLNRLGSDILEWYMPDLAIETQGQSTTIDIGGWQDWVGMPRYANAPLMVIANIQVSGESIQLQDSEVVEVGFASTYYVDEDSVYLLSQGGRLWAWEAVGPTTEIIRLSTDVSSGEITADAVGKVDGDVRDSRMLSEYQGDLRVMSNRTRSQLGNRGEFRLERQADLTVFRASDGQLKPIGKLEDIADGQGVYAAYFAGSRAIIATAEINPFTFQIGDDPLHGIDLSDPTNPTEMSDLEIPGVTTFLQWVHDDYLVGIGYVENSPNDWRWQLSLYDVRDLASPKVVDRWISQESVFPNAMGFAQNALAIHYEEASGTLVIPFSAFGAGFINTLNDRGEVDPSRMVSSAWVFQLDFDSPASIKLLGSISTPDPIQRTAIQGQTLFTISWETLRSYGLSDLSTPLDKLLIASRIYDDFESASYGASQEFHPLANDRSPADGKLVSVEAIHARGTLSIDDSGKKLRYVAPDSPLDILSGDVEVEVFEYVVRYSDGEQEKGRLTIYLVEGQPHPDFVSYRGTDPMTISVLENDHVPVGSKITEVGASVVGNQISIAADGQSIIYAGSSSAGSHLSDRFSYTVTLPSGKTMSSSVEVQLADRFDVPKLEAWLQAVDDEGDVLRTLQPDQEFWLELHVKDQRALPDAQVVFAAYSDISFDPKAFKVIGDAQGMGDFQSGVSGSAKDSGITSFGAFSDSLSPNPGQVEASVARIRLQARSARGNHLIEVSPAQEPGKEFLVYGWNEAMPSASVSLNSLLLKISDEPTTGATRSDTNSDGLVSALDALIVINYINAHSSLASGEGNGLAFAVPQLQVALDTNLDGVISPADALFVINELNLQMQAAGEGEETLSIRKKALRGL